MAKSTINLLQEISVKQGFVPIYNFTDKRLDGTIQFMCNVSCQQLKACGTGNSKKEAKHNAAVNMLLLLDPNNKIPLPIDNLSSSSVTSTIQSTAKVYETYPQYEKSTVDRNYVGLLQEFCQQKKIPTSNIIYELVSDKGPINMKAFTNFTIQVSVGSLREKATAQCKKTAKQQAARKLLLHLNPNVVNPNTVNLNTADSNTPNRLEVPEKEMLENNIRKLGTGILDCVSSKGSKESLAIAELSERAKSLYLERTNKKYGITDEKNFNPSAIKELHNLFEKNYSSKIQYNMREKMRIIRDRCTDQTDLWQIRRDIESSLKVKIQQITVHSKMKNHIICLRLLSNPCITQLGMGETKFIAESRATYNLVVAILISLNV